MHAPVSAEDLKALKADAVEPQFAGDFRDPQLKKLLPIILVFLGVVAGAIATLGSAAVNVLSLGGTAVMFLIILRLTRGDV